MRGGPAQSAWSCPSIDERDRRRRHRWVIAADDNDRRSHFLRGPGRRRARLQARQTGGVIGSAARRPRARKRSAWGSDSARGCASCIARRAWLLHSNPLPRAMSHSIPTGASSAADGCHFLGRSPTRPRVATAQMVSATDGGREDGRLLRARGSKPAMSSTGLTVSTR